MSPNDCRVKLRALTFNGLMLSLLEELRVKPLDAETVEGMGLEDAVEEGLRLGLVEGRGDHVHVTELGLEVFESLISACYLVTVAVVVPRPGRGAVWSARPKRCSVEPSLSLIGGGGLVGRLILSEKVSHPVVVGIEGEAASSREVGA
jgi:hypothetical protein